MSKEYLDRDIKTLRPGADQIVDLTVTPRRAVEFNTVEPQRPTLHDRHRAVHTAILSGPNAELQELIDSGLAWHLEGFMGRQAADALRDGAAVLPGTRYQDYWGNTVPSYQDVRDVAGSAGSVANAEAFDFVAQLREIVA
jgi:hypothetical protein